jgi:hypothetical protein
VSFNQTEQSKDWGSQLVEDLLFPFSRFAAPGFLLALMIFFVAQAFAGSIGQGLRSFAAVLLPLMVLTFLVKSSWDTSSWIGRIPAWASFSAMVMLAVATMKLLMLSTSAPVAELVLSSAFSIIALSGFRGEERDRAVPYCLGTVLGALGYVVVLGVPLLG